MRRDPRLSAWISLDSCVDEPTALFGLLAAALGSLFAVEPAVFDDLESPGVSVLSWADVAERSSYDGPTPDGSASFASARAQLRAAMCARGASTMMDDAEFAVSKEPAGSPRGRSALHVLLWACQLTGDLEAIESAAEQWLDAVEPYRNSGLALPLAEHSPVAITRDDWGTATADLERARACIVEWKIHEHSLAALTFVASARVAVHDGDQQSAREYLAQAMRSRVQATWAFPTFAVRFRLELARLPTAQADPAGARNLLREIDEILRRRPGLGVLVQQVDGLRQQLSTMPAGNVGVS